jgi:hypothetical protein
MVQHIILMHIKTVQLLKEEKLMSTLNTQGKAIATAIINANTTISKAVVRAAKTVTKVSDIKTILSGMETELQKTYTKGSVSATKSKVSVVLKMLFKEPQPGDDYEITSWVGWSLDGMAAEARRRGYGKQTGNKSGTKSGKPTVAQFKRELKQLEKEYASVLNADLLAMLKMLEKAIK